MHETGRLRDRRLVSDRTVNLFRYDNIHAHRGHTTKHHRHRFDLNGRETFVEHVGEDRWPNLGRVVEELYASWQGRTD
jgi:hypothetical protein